jgi:polyisoprenoid-binding protein YceI
MKRIAILLTIVAAAAACSSTPEDVAVQAAPPEAAVVEAAGIEEPITYRIAPGSKVWFVIDEMFRGSPKTVYGVNSKVAAEVVADPSDPSAVALGEVVVKAAFFDTEPGEEPSPLGDEIGWRDTAINRFILDSNEYPTITFLNLAGLDEPINVAGELTVRDTTRKVIFVTTVEIISDDRVEVTGYADVRRQDFGLKIPNVAHVADVSDDLRLELDLIFEPNDG